MAELFTLGVLSIPFLVLLIIKILLGGFVMLLAAKIASVKDATFGKCIVASIAVGIMSFIVMLIFGLLPIVGHLFGLLLALLLSVFIIKGMLSTSFGKALVVWLFDLILSVILGILAAAFFAAGLFVL